MDETQVGTSTVSAPLSDQELEQAAYALRELVRSGRDAQSFRVPARRVELIRPFFQLGWATAVRTGHTGPALYGVPVDSGTIEAAFTTLMAEAVSDRLALETARRLPQNSPALWQRVRYHGGLSHMHGAYWVVGMHITRSRIGYPAEVRYDLGRELDDVAVPMVRNVRHESVTALPEFHEHS
ncbi:hypothetical protein [Streptomyces sp. NBC_00568]|uniref:hypothetical protein n=1 Tax=Streptomyces sp. NBC_00568 TaxID=2975779 RepID=UPI002258EF7E|nr:hypothetical protein [Streptomyces sp. NBC_00568]MCX4993401.1 hypothetical protein [Streptomyces sp. NBC_00568]